MITLGLEGVPHGQVGVIDAGELPDRDPAALITSLEDRIRRLPGARDKNTAAIAENRDQIAKTKAELAKPSPYLQQLADARDALDRIEAEIDAQLIAPNRKQPHPQTRNPPPRPPGEPARDASAEPAADAGAPADDDIASLPPWTAGSPYSAAIGAALQAALADSDVTQVAGSNDLGRFLEWLSDTGWMSVYAAAAIGDEAGPAVRARGLRRPGLRRGPRLRGRHGGARQVRRPGAAARVSGPPPHPSDDRDVGAAPLAGARRGDRPRRRHGQMVRPGRCRADRHLAQPRRTAPRRAGRSSSTPAGTRSWNWPPTASSGG